MIRRPKAKLELPVLYLLLPPVHHVDSDGVPLVLQLGAGTAPIAVRPVSAASSSEESLSCNQEFVSKIKRIPHV